MSDGVTEIKVVLYYKCRRCSVDFMNEVTYPLYGSVFDKDRFSRNILKHRLTEIHECEAGRFGVSDLRGFTPEGAFCDFVDRVLK